MIGRRGSTTRRRRGSTYIDRECFRLYCVLMESAIPGTGWGCVASPRDSHLATAPRIPAAIPRAAPARKPPPMMKLIVAKGNVIKAPIAPRFINIIIPPVITVKPATTPMRVAIDCPRPEGPPNHQKIVDQLFGGPQKLGDSNATEFNSIRTEDAIPSVKPQTALFPVKDPLTIELGPTIPPATTTLRLCPQNGQ